MVLLSIVLKVFLFCRSERIFPKKYKIASIMALSFDDLFGNLVFYPCFLDSNLDPFSFLAFTRYID